MKYIRTKDYGVCKVMSEDKTTLSYENSEVIGCLWKDSYKDQIQYADAIEDLCDKFVIAWSNPTYYEIYDNFEDVEDWYHGEGVTAIYGAIWTEKGLIFVAKLKERKLELL